MKGGEEEEEEEDDEEHEGEKKEFKDEDQESTAASELDMNDEMQRSDAGCSDATKRAGGTCSLSPDEQTPSLERPTVKRSSSHGKDKAKSVHPEQDTPMAPQGEDQPPLKKSGKMIGPRRPPSSVSKQYPEDDPDYCVWVPPAGQTGDGRTHLNDKYGY